MADGIFREYRNFHVLYTKTSDHGRWQINLFHKITKAPTLGTEVSFFCYIWYVWTFSCIYHSNSGIPGKSRLPFCESGYSRRYSKQTGTSVCVVYLLYVIMKTPTKILPHAKQSLFKTILLKNIPKGALEILSYWYRLYFEKIRRKVVIEYRKSSWFYRIVEKMTFLGQKPNISSNYKTIVEYRNRIRSITARKTIFITTFSGENNMYILHMNILLIGSWLHRNISWNIFVLSRHFLGFLPLSQQP